MNNPWIIYGASGYTGIILAKEAENKGLKPILAGRSKQMISSVAEDIGFEYVIFDLTDDHKVQDELENFNLILNAAGPFKYTSEPIVRACLKTGTNYLDITGEIPVFEQNFTYHEQAKAQDIAIISGVGFDVVPTDCMAKYVSDKISNPTELEIGIVGIGNASRGTLKTMIEYLPEGTMIRRNGELIKNQKIKDSRTIKFVDEEYTLIPVSWGDLSTGYRTTGIPNITTYMPYSKAIASMIKSNTSQNNGTIDSSLNGVIDWIDKNVYGPDKEARMKGRSYIWAQVMNDRGDKKEAWLETMEGYRFTSISGIKAVEKIFELKPKGSLTPALAFGEDFILEFPETQRYDASEK